MTSIICSIIVVMVLGIVSIVIKFAQLNGEIDHLKEEVEKQKSREASLYKLIILNEKQIMNVSEYVQERKA